MIHFDAQINKLRFDLTAFERDADSKIQEILKGAMGAWLDAVLEHVPVRTGMARGALSAIAEWAEKEIDFSAAVPVGDRNAFTGSANGVLDLSNFHFPHYIIGIQVQEINGWLWEKHDRLWNERLQDYVYAGPWHSFEAGRLAFVGYLKENLKQSIPSILKYRTKTKPEEV